jgi:DNA modification methylase
MKSKIIQGNCIEVMKKMSDNSIQCIVTSPPYWGLRDYGHKDQVGLEDTPEEYVNHLVKVFAECKRILKNDGTIWLNLGDTYYSKGGASRHKGYNDPKYPNGRTGEFEEPQTKPHKFLKAKDLCGIPFRVAFALQERLGLYLRQAIIWHKPNAMPSSVTDRPTTDYEFVFLLTKSERYVYNQDEVSEDRLTQENRPDGIVRQRTFNYKGKFSNFGDKSEQYGSPRVRTQRNSKYVESDGHSNRAGLERDPTYREKRIFEIIQPKIAKYIRKYLNQDNKKILDDIFGQHKWTHWIRTDKSGASLPSPEDWNKLKEILKFDKKYDKVMTETEIYLDDGLMWKNKSKNLRAVWSFNTVPYPEAHFAVFPEELPERCIKAGTKEGDTVLDPFAGSGTTVWVAKRMLRNGIGIELSEKYIKLSKKRTAQETVSNFYPQKEESLIGIMFNNLARRILE